MNTSYRLQQNAWQQRERARSSVAEAEREWVMVGVRRLDGLTLNQPPPPPGKRHTHLSQAQHSLGSFFTHCRQSISRGFSLRIFLSHTHTHHVRTRSHRSLLRLFPVDKTSRLHGLLCIPRASTEVRQHLFLTGRQRDGWSGPNWHILGAPSLLWTQEIWIPLVNIEPACESFQYRDLFANSSTKWATAEEVWIPLKSTDVVS